MDEKEYISTCDKVERIRSTLELKYDMQIVFAAEAGSRAWGFPSKDSDYDVRFVYVHKREWYLDIDRGRDVIEKPNLKLLSAWDDNFDVCGWELQKALRLFRKNNPPFIEWLHSPYQYHDGGVGKYLKHLIPNYFQTGTSVHHYLSMAKRNWKEYLVGERVWTKKYFYVIRPILACSWIEKYKQVPPVQFERLLPIALEASILRHGRAISGDGGAEYGHQLLGKVFQLLEQKKDGLELDEGPRIPILNDFIAKEMDYFEGWAKEQPKIDMSALAPQLNWVFNVCLEQKEFDVKREIEYNMGV